MAPGGLRVCPEMAGTRAQESPQPDLPLSRRVGWDWEPRAPAEAADGGLGSRQTRRRGMAGAESPERVSGVRPPQ